MCLQKEFQNKRIDKRTVFGSFYQHWNKSPCKRRTSLLGLLLLFLCLATATVFAESDSGDENEPKSFNKICIEFDDNDNAKDTRPTQGRFIVYDGAGNSIGKDVVITSSGGWKANAGPYTGYSVEEDSRNRTSNDSKYGGSNYLNWLNYPSYTSEVTEDGEYIIRYSMYPEINELSFKIVWADGGNKMGKRPSPDEIIPKIYLSNTTNSRGSRQIQSETPIITDNGDDTWTLTFPGVSIYPTRTDRYVWLNWTGENEENYYTDVTNNGFGAMSFDILNNNQAQWQVRQEAKHRELSITLRWQDFNNAYNTRPSVEDFVPHLYYGKSGQADREFVFERDEDYTIRDNGNGTWTITYKAVPTSYYDSSKTPPQMVTNGMTYWFTWDGSTEYYNQALTSNEAGVMCFSSTTKNPSVTTILKDKPIKIRLNWADNGNAEGKRPSPDQVKPKLWYGYSSGTYGCFDLEDDVWKITDNGNNSWTLSADRVPIRGDTTSGKDREFAYYWLTLDGADDYRAEGTSDSYWGYMRFESSEDKPTVTVYPKERTRRIRLHWQDSKDAAGQRPSVEEVLDSLKFYGGSNYRVSKELTGSTISAEVVNEQEEYWDIDITGLPNSYETEPGKTATFEYYWITWGDGSEQYINQVTSVNQANTYSTSDRGPMLFKRDSTSREDVYCYLKDKEFTVYLYWSDDDNAAGKRPTTDEIIPQLWAARDQSVIKELETGDYTIEENGKNCYIIRFKNAPLFYTDDNGEQMGFPYYGFTWKTADYTESEDYYNQLKTKGLWTGPSSSQSMNCTCYLKKKQQSRSLDVTLWWNGDRNHTETRPNPDSFKPILGYGDYNGQWGTFDEADYKLVTTDNGNHSWLLKFTQIPNYTPDQRGYDYTWITWEPVEGYSENNTTTAPYYSSAYYDPRFSAHRQTANIYYLSKRDLTLTLNWSDRSNQTRIRPGKDGLTPHLWIGSNEKASAQELKYSSYVINDKAGNNSWKITFKDLEVGPNNSSRYFWLTWEGDNADRYYSDIRTNLNPKMNFRDDTSAPSVTCYEKRQVVAVRWYDDEDAQGFRPSTDELRQKLKLYYGTSEEVIGSIDLPASDITVTQANKQLYYVAFRNLPLNYTADNGTETRIPYFWMTFDSDKYISDLTTNGHGALKFYNDLQNNREVTVYLKKERPMTITLNWRDGGNVMGKRPKPEEFTPHLSYGSNHILGNLADDLTYTITDNGNDTWTIYYDAVPNAYTDENGEEQQISTYFLTYNTANGADPFYTNDVEYANHFGAMTMYANNMWGKYSVNTYGSFYQLDLRVNWNNTNNFKNTSSSDLQHKDVTYDILDTFTGEVLESWEPDNPNNTYYTHTFYLPGLDENGNKVDKDRYVVRQNGLPIPGVFETSTMERQKTGTTDGKDVIINNDAIGVNYRFNFTFKDSSDEIGLRPAKLDYEVKERGGNNLYSVNRYIPDGYNQSLQSSGHTFTSGILPLLGRDFWTGVDLTYDVNLLNLPAYYDVDLKRVVDDDGVVNLNYTFTLKKNRVLVTKEWAGEDEPAKRQRPYSTQIQLLANGQRLRPAQSPAPGTTLKDETVVTLSKDNADPENPDIWYTMVDLPLVDADGNKIVWTGKEGVDSSLVNYHVDEYSDPIEGGGRHINVINTYESAWNYKIDLEWAHVPDENRYDRYETTLDDSRRTYCYQIAVHVNNAKYEVGDLEIRLPYYIEAVGPNGQKKYVGIDNPAQDIGVPKAPAHSSDTSKPFNWYLDDHGTKNDKSDDELVLVNWEEIDSSPNGVIQVYYRLYPDEHLDTHVYEIQATGYGHAEGQQDGFVEVQKSKAITFGMDTGIDIRSFNKNQSKLLYYYDTSYINASHLSREAYDPDRYRYVAYEVSWEATMNQYSHFTLNELPGQKGEIVSVRTRSSSNSVTGITYSGDKRAWTVTVDPQRWSSHYSSAYCSAYVVVAYPRENNPEAIVKLPDGRVVERYSNEAKVEGTASHKQNPDDLPVPPQDLNDKDHMRDAVVTDWGDYRWKPTGKIFAYEKRGNREFPTGGLTALEYSKDISCSFYLNFYAEGEELMLDGVHEFYRFNITDNEFYLQGLVNGVWTAYEKLEPEDYEITSVAVSLSSYETDHRTGATLPHVPQGAFIIQGQVGETGEWENVVNYTWPATSSSTTASFGSPSLSGRGYTGFRVLTPDHVSRHMGFQGVTFNVRLNAKSEKVQKLIAQGMTRVGLLNIAAFPMEVEEPDGSYTLYTEIPKPDHDPAVGTPTHVDSPAYHVGLYDTDEDRKDYIPDEALDARSLIYDHHRYEAGPVTSSVGSDKVFSTPVGDAATEIAKSTFKLKAYQTLGSTGLPAEINEQISVDEGYFYDLLPTGWHFDADAPIVVRGYTGNGDENSVTAFGKPAAFVEEPKVIPDYRGSGRELVVFHVKALSELRRNYYSYQDRMVSGFVLNFGGYISYNDVFTNYTYEITENGDQRIIVTKDNYNLMAFQGVELDENGEPITDASGHYKAQKWELMHQNPTSQYHDDGYYDDAIWNVRGSDGEYALSDLNGDGVTNVNDTLFARAYGSPNFAIQAFTGVNKEVRAVSGKWQKHDVTDLDEIYEYRLSFSIGGKGKAYNVVIYDVLEEAANTDDKAQEGYKGSPGYPNEHSWQGSFDSVDVSELEAQGIAPVVYYSTLPKQQLDYNIDPLAEPGESTMDIDGRPDVWSTELPADPSAVTAVAVDMRRLTEKDAETGEPLPAVFEESKMREAAFVIRMKAPTQLPEDRDAILAFNRPAYVSTLEANAAPKTSFNVNDRVSVEIMDLQDVVIQKTTTADDDPDQEIKLAGVFFHLYKAKCGLPDGEPDQSGKIHNHVAPPTDRNTAAASSNGCWERIGVVQTTVEGIAKFEKLEEGDYAVREYNPYYSQSLYSSGGSYATAYNLSPSERWENQWWQFTVDSRKGEVSEPVYKGKSYYTIDKDIFVATDDEERNQMNYENLFVANNTRRRVEIRIEKFWQDRGVDDEDRPVEIQVNLLRDGKVMDNETLKAFGIQNPITLMKENNWKIEPVRGLPMTDPYGQHVYAYTVQEVSIPQGYQKVYDTNQETYHSTNESLEYNRVMYYNRNLTNVKTDQLLVGKTVKEGGDRQKLFNFRLTLIDPLGKAMAGETFPYTVYTDYGTDTQQEARSGTFRTDASGVWNRLQLRHNEFMVIHDMSVNSKAVLKETDADGYEQSYTPSSTVTIVDSSTGKTETGKKIYDDTKNRVEIRNEYKSHGLDKISLYKSVNGERPAGLKNKVFKFALNEYKPDDLVTTERMDGASAVAITFPYTVQNDGTGEIFIPQLRWTTETSGYEKDIWYTIREEERTGADAQGLTIDKALYVVKAHLKDDGKGVITPKLTMYRVSDPPEVIDSKSLSEAVTGLTPVPMDKSGAVVRNLYEAKGILAYSLKKTINKDSVPGGRPDAKPYHLNTFEFTLTEWNSTWKEILGSWTVKNNGEGTAQFPDFIYDEKSIQQRHRYTLTEKTVDDKGYTQDKTAYVLTVVIEDAGQGKLSAIMDIQSGEVDVEAKKVVPGAVLSQSKLVLPTDKNASDYEEMLATLTQKMENLLKFNNVYTAHGVWNPTITKLINGQKMETDFLSHGNIFTITLTDVTNPKAPNAIGSKDIGENALATFEVVYDETDIGNTYTYELKESGTAGQGTKLSDSVITVKLRVDDLGDGKLKPVILSMTEGSEQESGKDNETVTVHTFDNPYVAKGELPLTILKSVEGPVLNRNNGKPAIVEAALEGNDFTFVLQGDESDNRIFTAKNDTEGKVSFNIDFARENSRDDRGTHVYTLREETDGKQYYNFDRTSYTLTVEVTDDYEGHLAIDVKEIKRTGGDSANEASVSVGQEEMTFHNPTATTELSVTKVWSDGRNDEITLTLFANGERLDPQPKPVREGQRYVYHDLPRYDEDGETIVWSVRENVPEGYMVIYDNIEPYTDKTREAYDGSTIRNRAMLDFCFFKRWEGKKVEAGTPISIQIYKDGKPFGHTREVVPDEQGRVVLYNLPADGEYTVVENAPPDFTAVYMNNDDGKEPATCIRNMGTIINRYVPKTGDTSRGGLWLALTVLSCLALSMTKLIGRRAKDEDAC